MRIFSGVRDFLGKFLKVDMVASEFEAAKIFYKELAIQSCISVIANALVLSEFETYENGKKIKANNYYLFNIEPNQNQNATEFWTQVISKLVYENECLVIMKNDKLYVADSFDINKYTFYEDKYTNIVVKDYPLRESMLESEVLYFKLNDVNIKNIIDGLYMDYSKILGGAFENYKKANGRRGTLDLGTFNPQSEEDQKLLQDLMNNKFKTYFEATNAVLPLQKGMKYDEKPNQSNIKDSRDIRAVIDDIIEFTAMGLHVPPLIIKGDTAGIEAVTDNFLMFGVNPFAKLITSEINRKIYGKKLVLENTCVKVNTRNIKNTSLEKLAKACDLLFRIGAYSINDVINEIDGEVINESWANEHYVTKNYQKVIDGGGKKNGKENSQT